jgi:hypothetical protein
MIEERVEGRASKRDEVYGGEVQLYKLLIFSA